MMDTNTKDALIAALFECEELRSENERLAAEVGRLRAALDIDAVERYIQTLPWSGHETDDDRTLVDGNIRGFAAMLRAALELKPKP